MSVGVIYFVGRSYATRFVVSVWSLRKYHKEIPITLFSLPKAHEIGDHICRDERLQVEHRPVVPIRDDYLGTLATKPLLAALSPYDTSLYIDADTVAVASLNDLLSEAKNREMVLTRLADWTYGHSQIQEKCNAWRDVGKDVAAKITSVPLNAPAINTGVYSFHKGFSKLADWAALTIRGIDKPVPDEMAVQLLLPELEAAGVKVLDDRWNCSPTYGVNRNNAAIWHFHSDLHRTTDAGAKYWWPRLLEAVEKNIGNIRSWGP